MEMENLPLGFRFRPTDVELINHYLRLKINGRHSEVDVIPEVDVCKWEPWDLPGLSVIKSEDPEWFFFCPRDRKYPNGHRSNRATDAGYWKATGKDRTIKSRKSSPSGQSSPHLIGMKKTLVFHRGRAPKGERSNWIMHEYRVTEPDLDGTASDQAPYVLCRLFRKPDEKTDTSKYDEVEPIVSSPTTVRSSPDDSSSDLFEEQSLLDAKVGKQPEAMTGWLTDKSDEMTSNSRVHVESCMSDAEDHSTGAAASKKCSLLGGDPMCHKSMTSRDQKILSPLGSNCNTDMACPDSPFADDFGGNHNGLHFQDGTSEQDVSLTELLDNLQNHEEYPCEGSTTNKFSDMGILSGNSDSLHQGIAKSGNLPVHGLFTERNSSMLQGQVQSSQQWLHARVSDRDAECTASNLCSLGDQYAGNDMSSAYSVMQPLYDPEHSFAHINPATHGSNVKVGTGIRIRQRQPQPQNRASPENLTAQGTAARRILLQMDHTEACSDANNFNDEKQEESIITEAGEDSTSRSTCDGPEMGSIVSDHKNGVEEQEGQSGFGLRNNFQDGKSTFPWSGFRGINLAKIYALSLYMVIALSVIFVGVSKCPCFGGLYC